MLSFLRTVKSVLWGFFGVRRGCGYDADIAHNKPAPLILTGLLMASLPGRHSGHGRPLGGERRAVDAWRG